MRSILALILIFLIVSLPVFAGVFLEPGVGLLYDYSRYNQNSPEQTFEHRGHGLGGEIFGRAGLGIGPVKMGVTGNYASLSEGHRTRYRSTVSDYAHYSNSFKQDLLGYYLGFNDPKTGGRWFGEYYSHAHRKTSYSDGDNHNHLHQDDHEKGHGFGIGVGVARPLFGFSLVYRDIKFTDYLFKDADSRADLRNQVFEVHHVHQFLMQLSIPFELFGPKSVGGGKGISSPFDGLEKIFSGPKKSK